MVMLLISVSVAGVFYVTGADRSKIKAIGGEMIWVNSRQHLTQRRAGSVVCGLECRVD
jgi:hypothetical protein